MLRVNGWQLYVWRDRDSVTLIDTGAPGSAAEILAKLPGIDRIVLTHGHVDHVGSAADLRASTGAPVMAGAGAGGCGQVIRQDFIGVTDERLVAATESSAVVGDHPVTRRVQHVDLGRPGFTGQRPAVDQYHGPSLPAGVVDVQVRLANRPWNLYPRRPVNPRLRAVATVSRRQSRAARQWSIRVSVVKVVAFVPVHWTDLADLGVSATGMPMPAFAADHIPGAVAIPLVVVLLAKNGEDNDPHLFILSKSPDGEVVGGEEWNFHWADEPDRAYKYLAGPKVLNFHVQQEALYTLGLYADKAGMLPLTELPFVVTQAR